MPFERVDEKLLVRYLLGNLSEEEQVQVEDQVFADAACMNALEASESDLIDSYVRGGLSQSDRRLFERQFLTSPNRRSKVEFARALAKVAADSKAAEAAPRHTLLSLVRAPRPSLQMAAAVAALFFVPGIFWLAFKYAEMRSQIGVLESQRREYERREQTLVGQQTTTSSPIVASLVLLPGVSRGATETEELILTASTQIAHIAIQLEERDDLPRFRAELRTRRGEDVLTRANLARQRTAGGYAVSFDVPASALAPGNYEIALKGIGEGQAVTDIGYYSFSVRKQ